MAPTTQRRPCSNEARAWAAKRRAQIEAAAVRRENIQLGQITQQHTFWPECAQHRSGGSLKTGAASSRRHRPKAVHQHESGAPCSTPAVSLVASPARSVLVPGGTGSSAATKAGGSGGSPWKQQQKQQQPKHTASDRGTKKA
mmetsp:Transcript_134413/g.268260  ORF Transcript_134413/g.268260 Transcript_134413/m.268260 type:complete len:142 (+) Transcript_134413:176-601(+)